MKQTPLINLSKNMRGIALQEFQWRLKRTVETLKS